MRTLALLLALIPACVGAAEGSLDEELTNADFDPTPSWVVWIQVPSGSCSALTLTQKWILTSAHCVAADVAAHGTYATNRLRVSRANTEGQPYYVYGAPSGPAGGAAFYVHPDFVPDTGDVDDDIALIHLDGAGMTHWSPARLYDDYAYWHWSGWLVYISAFGQGDDAGQSVSCGSNPAGTQRRAQFTTTGVYGGKWTRIQSSANPHHVCPGDSGSPFLLSPDGYDLAFALTKRYDDSTIAEGTLIPPKLSWITTQAAAAGDSIYCGRYLIARHYYRSCRD